MTREEFLKAVAKELPDLKGVFVLPSQVAILSVDATLKVAAEIVRTFNCVDVEQYGVSIIAETLESLLARSRPAAEKENTKGESK